MRKVLNSKRVLEAAKQSSNIAEVCQLLGKKLDEWGEVVLDKLMLIEGADHFLLRNEAIRGMRLYASSGDENLMKSHRLDFIGATAHLIKHGLISREITKSDRTLMNSWVENEVKEG